MKKNVISIRNDATVKDAARLMLGKKIGTLPVVNENGIMVGLTTIQAIAQIFLPDFVGLLSNIDFIKDFGVTGIPSIESFAKADEFTVVDIMEEPVVVESSSGLVRVLSVMTKHDIQDLPVCEDGVLVRIASRVDILRGLLSEWQNDETREKQPK
ncbi:MAG: CBS domain-containing protein [Anaerolineaceae bacterium]|nr:CBS domain-containing protein [Anaerolineaceae bacterium]